MMSKKLNCIITGKSITVPDEYYNKKITEHGSEEELTNHYVSRQAKNLLKRGYKIDEIRNLLKVKITNPISESQIKKILKMDDGDVFSDLLTVKKSDPDVERFVNILKSKNSTI